MDCDDITALTRAVPWILACGLLAGCMVGPEDYRRPELGLNPGFVSAPRDEKLNRRGRPRTLVDRVQRS